MHIRYKDLVRDPYAIVTDLYRHFGMTLSGPGEQGLKRSIAERPDGGYGRNSYRFEDYGLNPAAERKHHSAYMAHFRMQPEEPTSRAVTDSSVRLAV